MIAPWFHGDNGYAHVGYLAGRLAKGFGTTAQVVMRKVVPVGVRFSVARHSDRVQLELSGQIHATARAAAFDFPVVLPDPEATLDAAHRAALLPGPYCTVCGEQRAGGGLHVSVAPLLDHPGIVAGTWGPHGALSSNNRTVDSEFIWAALSCPSAAAHANDADAHSLVLRALAVSLQRPVVCDAPYMAVGWQLGVDGCKRFAGAALMDTSGNVCATAHSVWLG